LTDHDIEKLQANGISNQLSMISST
jgi:hypothetical protein